VLIKDPTKCTGIVNDAPFLMATYAWPAKSYDNLVLAPDSYFGIVSSSKQVDKNNQIAIYPNQLYVGELVHINGIESDVDKIMISVSNLAGKKVFETSLTSKYEFYVPTIAAGVYLLSINAAGFNNTVKLLVK
ncbi:MAG: T9SS type A sorting domain-containing protein, partial [Paludibacter sp.]